MAAIARTMMGRIPTRASNTPAQAFKAGNLADSETDGHGNKARHGRHHIPRKLILFQTLPSSCFTEEEPITGRYLIFHSFGEGGQWRIRHGCGLLFLGAEAAMTGSPATGCQPWRFRRFPPQVRSSPRPRAALRVDPLGVTAHQHDAVDPPARIMEASFLSCSFACSLICSSVFSSLAARVPSSFSV